MTPEKTPAQIRLEDSKELRYTEAVEWIESLGIHDPGAPKELVAEIFARSLRTEGERARRGQPHFRWNKHATTQRWMELLNIDPVTLQVRPKEEEAK